MAIATPNCRRNGSLIRPPLICTIGHSTRPIDVFLHLLQTNQIVRVLDVRTVPRSRHNPQFNFDILPTTLEAVNISYIHLPGLGGLRHAHKGSVNLGWRNLSFRGYADYMQSTEFDENIQWVVSQAHIAYCALMCAEALPWHCHRSMISDALLIRGVCVEDIIGKNGRKPHTLTSFARINGTQITYPLSTTNIP